MSILITPEELNTYPLFVVIDGDKQYKLWADGRVEGFGPDAFVGNAAAAFIATMNARHIIAIQNLCDLQTASPSPDPASHTDCPGSD
jgi:hypothetical protein